jgi:hypothetical protein
MPTLGELALHKSDRAILLGGTGSGKSTLARFLLEEWQNTFCQPSIPIHRRGRLLVADTKPRWRASHALTGPSTHRRYKHFVKGDKVTGVAVAHPQEWRLAWDPKLNPTQTVILQNLDLTDDQNVFWQVHAIEAFFRSQRFERPSLLYVDEGMDFYGPTGSARYGSAIQRCYRAGREKGMATLLGTQRPKSINLQTLTESNVLYLFRLDFAADVKRLYEMGFPARVEPPAHDHQFLYMRAKRLHPRPLTIPKGALRG